MMRERDIRQETFEEYKDEFVKGEDSKPTPP